MRLWSIGLLVLVLVGLLIAIGQAGLFSGVLEHHELGHTFHDYQRGSIDYVDSDGREIFAAQSHPDVPLILSGLPSYAGKRFRFPVDSRPIAGTYRLTYNVDAAAGVEGAMRVTINGVRRADVVLEAGRHQQSMQIELTPAELSSGGVDVRLALIGRGPIAECSPGEALTAVAQILPESGLHLTLDTPLSTARDQLAWWGDLVPVKWDSHKPKVDTLTLLGAARLAEQGYAVYFGDKGIAGQDLLRLANEARRRTWHIAYAGDLTYPIALAASTENQGARRFDRETTWRFSYATTQLPGGRLPASLDLRMRIGPLAETRTALFVMLNGHLLHTSALKEGNEHFHTSIALPPELHKERNLLEIALGVHAHDDLRCGSTRLVAAELLPGTVLTPGTRLASTGTQRLQRLLALAQPVDLRDAALTATDAQAAAQLLGRLAPLSTTFSGKDPRASIDILSGDLAAGLARLAPHGGGWIVYFPDDRRETLIIRRYAGGTAPEGARVLLLIRARDPALGIDPAQTAGDLDVVSATPQ